MPKFNNITGNKYGRLVALCREENNTKNQTMWKFICDCSNIVIKRAGDVTNGKIKSCGCLLKETTSLKNKTHGKSNTRLYKIWLGMNYRCNDSRCNGYKHYGGKGISVCDEWKTFLNFEQWAIDNGYSDNLTIDRIDNSKNYNSENCIWSTMTYQNRHTSRNIVYNGICASDRSIELGGTKNLVNSRLHKGWSIKEAFETKLLKYPQERFLNY